MKRTARRTGSSNSRVRSIPIRKAPKSRALDAAAFIPVVLGDKGRAGLRVIRRTDLLPKSKQALLVAGGIDFGETLLDTFTPRYGSYHPLGEHYFEFHHSLLTYSGESWWGMQLAENAGSEQELQFKVFPRGQGSYLKVLVGQTGDLSTDRCILSVRVNGTEFAVDLYSRGFQYFDVYLPATNASVHDVELALRFAPNGHERAVCVLHQIELYSSIRAFPDERFIA